MLDFIKCPLCGHQARHVGSKMGLYKVQSFDLCTCDYCHFSFVENPWLDYKKIYDLKYYEGKGADKTINHCFEFDNFSDTVRQYEWKGILEILKNIGCLSPGKKWLDYGCGAGGLVRYSRQAGYDTYGYDEGEISTIAQAKGVPIIGRKELVQSLGTFDIITAIEVLEHVPNPIETLKHIRSLLKDSGGGVFFFTTGNSKPFRNKLLKWYYFVPEIHISLFEPMTLEYALNSTGFSIKYLRGQEGWTDIIRFKILKNLGIRCTSGLERILPWKVITRCVDRYFGVSHYPIAYTK